jgi:hypothetical protein
MELRKAARRVQEEHQAETAQHGVECAIVETERLTVLDHDGGVRRAGQPLARPIHHGLGDVDGRDVAAGADHGESSLRRNPGTGRDVEHPLARLQTRCPQQEREEMRRDVSEGPVVRACGLVLI